MRPQCLAWVWVPLLLVPCGCDRDPARELNRVHQSVDSWRATLDETANQWEKRRVPTTYVNQLAAAAGRSLEDQAKSLAKVPTDDPRGRELRQQVDGLRQRAQDLSRAATDGGRRP